MNEMQSLDIPHQEDRPLVTFALFSYNQEKYIREAVKGAFAQTYEPMEIILSDDCSTDNTFNIIQEMAQKYQGPHKVILNKNISNMGISAHVRYIDEISKGEYIVHAAGDDISYPHRTSTAIKSILNEKSRPSLIGSNARKIDENGNALGLLSECLKDRIINKSINPLDLICGGGCTFIIHRSLIDLFNKPMKQISFEDRLLAIRANMLNGCLVLPDTLLDYRVTNNGTYSGWMNKDLKTSKVIENQIKWTKEQLYTLEQAAEDAISLGGEETEYRIKCIEKEKRKQNRWLAVATAPFLHSSLAALTETILTVKSGKKTQILKLYAIRWIPGIRRIKSYV